MRFAGALNRRCRSGLMRIEPGQVDFGQTHAGVMPPHNVPQSSAPCIGRGNQPSAPACARSAIASLTLFGVAFIVTLAYAFTRRLGIVRNRNKGALTTPLALPVVFVLVSGVIFGQ